MRIAVIGPRGFPGIQGGVEKHCENLYPRLVKLGHEVVVFTRRPYMGAGERRFKGVRLVPVACPRQKHIEAILYALGALLLIPKYRPDLLHIHAVGPALVTPLARLSGLKVVFTTHGPDYERKKWSAAAKIFLKLGERMGSRFAREVITISSPIAADLFRKYGRESHTIPNGVNIPPPVGPGSGLTRFGLKRGRYILAVGRLVPEKGFDDLVDAFSSLHHPDWKLAIVGKADHRDRYSESLRLKIKDCPGVVATGFLSGLPLAELYGNAGLLAVPSYYEGLPFSLLEGASYGLPVLASDISALKAVSLPLVRYFPVGDSGLLASALREMINEHFPDRAREEQIKSLRADYDWDKIARATEAVYRQAVNI